MQGHRFFDKVVNALSHERSILRILVLALGDEGHIVRGEMAGRGARYAPGAVRTSTAVGTRPPFWCSEPRMKISSQGLSQLRTTPQPARSQATRPSRLVRAESLQRHQPSASGVPSRHANLTRATEGSTRHRCRRWTLLSSTSHFIFHAVSHFHRPFSVLTIHEMRRSAILNDFAHHALRGKEEAGSAP